MSHLFHSQAVRFGVEGVAAPAARVLAEYKVRSCPVRALTFGHRRVQRRFAKQLPESDRGTARFAPVHSAAAFYAVCRATRRRVDVRKLAEAVNVKKAALVSACEEVEVRACAAPRSRMRTPRIVPTTPPPLQELCGDVLAILAPPAKDSRARERDGAAGGDGSGAGATAASEDRSADERAPAAKRPRTTAADVADAHSVVAALLGRNELEL